MGIFKRFGLVAAAVVVASVGAAHLRGLSNSYEFQTAKGKQAYLWSQITADETSHPWPSFLELAHVFLESMSPTVTYVSDEFPAGRSKLIHSVGATAKAQFVWNGQGNYTGIFSGKSADYAIIRFSSALEPVVSSSTKTNPADSSNFIPAIGFKILRDGVPSANFMSMRFLYSVDSWNIFKHPFSNHLSSKDLDLKTKALAHKFGTVSDWPFFLGLRDVASFNQNGQLEAAPYFPYQLIFYPTSQVSNLFPDNYVESFKEQLKTVPSGTAIYDIYAKETPGAHPVNIGTLYSTSEFVTSDYADNTMFLKHQTFDGDVARRSDWSAVCPTADACPVCPTEVSCYD